MLLNCRGILLDLANPKVMGILNLTPDSFFDGGKYQNDAAVILQIEGLINEGADIIDIGGMSSRPGAKIVAPNEEWDRISFAITYILENHPEQLISVDTLHSEVAEKALVAGVQIINDISAGKYDSEMMSTVSKYKACYIMMHMKSIPEEMHNQTEYKKGMGVEIMSYFKEQISKARKLGITEIILDLGFGFSKTMEQNYQLMNMLHTFRIFSIPLLTGISRKSMLYKLLGTSAEGSLNGSSALHMKALLEGSSILRVHDVKEAKEVIKLYRALKNDFQ